MTTHLGISILKSERELRALDIIHAGGVLVARQFGEGWWTISATWPPISPHSPTCNWIRAPRRTERSIERRNEIGGISDIIAGPPHCVFGIVTLVAQHADESRDQPGMDGASVWYDSELPLEFVDHVRKVLPELLKDFFQSYVLRTQICASWSFI